MAESKKQRGTSYFPHKAVALGSVIQDGESENTSGLSREVGGS